MTDRSAGGSSGIRWRRLALVLALAAAGGAAVIWRTREVAAPLAPGESEADDASTGATARLAMDAMAGWEASWA